MRYLFLGLLFWIIHMGTLSAQPDSLLHQPYAKRYRYVEDLERQLTFKRSSQQALDSLQQMMDHVTHAGDKAFAYHLSFIRTSSMYMRKPGAEEEIRKLITKAAQQGYTYEAVHGQVKLAAWLWRPESRSDAIELGLNAYDLYKHYPLDEFPMRAHAQGTLAAWYFHFEDYHKAKDLMLELLAASSGKMPEKYPHATMILALAYRGLKQYDSALHYFQDVYNYRGELFKEENKALAAGNIGSIYFFAGQYGKAIEWFKTELAIWKQFNDNTTLASMTAYIYTADAYIQGKDLATAEKYLDSAGALKKKVRRSFIDYRKYYSLKVTLLKASGRYEQALIYTDSISALTDSINNARNKAQVLAAENKVAAANHQKELEYLRHLRRNSIWVRNFAIIVILLLATVVSLLINRSRMKHRQNELYAINEKNKAEKKLLAFTQQFQEQNRQIDDLREELQNMTDEQDVAAKNETILRLQQSTILTDDQWDEFRVLFEEVHTGFISQVKEKFPGLTPAELRYLTLLKLNLTNKEMAAVLGVNTNTVHNYKSRLRRKYSIPDDVLLEDIIHSV